MELLSQELRTRLLACRTYFDHDPCPHVCPGTPHCTNRVKMVEPTEFAVAPLQLYADFKNQEFKNSLKLATKKSKTCKLEYCYLTINPKPEITFINFKKKIFQLLNTKVFADHLAVFEQRGTLENDLGKGFHSHILFKRHTPLNEGLPPSNIKRNLKQSFSAICDVNNPKIFNIQFIGEEFACDKHEYIIGHKTGEGKDLKQTGDAQWRKINNIEPYYGNHQIV